MGLVGIFTLPSQEIALRACISVIAVWSDSFSTYLPLSFLLFCLSSLFPPSLGPYPGQKKDRAVPGKGGLYSCSMRESVWRIAEGEPAEPFFHGRLELFHGVHQLLQRRFVVVIFVKVLLEYFHRFEHVVRSKDHHGPYDGL